MHPGRVARALTTLGLATAGLVGGHALGYWVAVPDEAHRTTLLGATGHGYLPSASRLAVIFGIAAVIAGVAAGYLAGGRAGRASWRSFALRLGLLQGGGFVALEVLERLAASAPMASLSAGVVVIGLLSQVLIAVVGGLLIVGLRRLGTAIGRPATPAAAGVLVAPRPRAVRLSSRFGLVDRVRGPPPASVP